MSLKAQTEVLQRVEELVNQHRAMRDEPLLLAVYFEPTRSPGDIFLFEVIEGFGAGTVDEDKKFFEVSYPVFSVNANPRLHLILTSPEEFEVAAREGWSSLDEVRQAIRAGSAMTVFNDPARPDLEARLNG